MGQSIFDHRCGNSSLNIFFSKEIFSFYTVRSFVTIQIFFKTLKMYFIWMVLVIIPYCSSIPVDKNLEHKNDIIHDDNQHQLLNTRIKRLQVVHPDNLDPDEETLKKLLLVTPQKPINNINSVYDYNTGTFDYDDEKSVPIKEDIFPARRGFFTGHRIPFELFSKDTIQRLNVQDPLVAPVSHRVVASRRGGVPRRPLPSHIKTNNIPKKFQLKYTNASEFRRRSKNIPDAFPASPPPTSPLAFHPNTLGGEFDKAYFSTLDSFVTDF